MATETQMKRMLVRFEAELGKYHSELNKSKKETGKWRKKVNKDVDFVKTAFKGLVVGLSARAAASYYQAHADGIDKLAKTADKLGTPVEQLQGLHHAAELSGVATNTLDTGLQRMTRRIAEAAKGTGEARGAIDELGLSAQRLAEMSPDQQFRAISDAMKGVESQGDRVRLTMKLFDSEGVALVNTLNMGSEGLNAATAEIDQFGGAISRIDAAKVEAANDQFTRANQVSKALGTRIAIETADIVGGLANEFLNAAKEAGGMGNVVRKSIDIVVKVVGVAWNAVHALKIAWVGVRIAVNEGVHQMLLGFRNLALANPRIAEKLGIDSETFGAMGRMSIDAQREAALLKAQIDNMLMEKIPSDRIVEWVEDVRVKAQSAAEETARNSRSMGGLLLGDMSENEFAKQSPEEKAEKEKLSILERLQKANHDRRLQQEAAFQAKIIQFQQASSKDKVKTLLSEGVALTQGAASTSKKLFKINQALALADAAVTLPSAVLKAVERGGGWPWGYAFGALTLANGLAKINAIRKAKFGGGTSASLAGTTGGATPTVDTTPTDVESIAGQREKESERGFQQIIFQGDVYGYEEFQDKLVTTLADASNNNRVRVVDSSGKLNIEVT